MRPGLIPHPPAASPAPSFSTLREIACCAVAVVALGLAPTAHATLGGARDSVEADRAHMSAKLASAGAATQTIHALTLVNGGVIKEFARSDGVVFAVAWRGPSRPDLRQLLGARFDVLQSDNVMAGGRRTRRPLTVRRSDFVLMGGGHPGGFHGFAYLPGQAPAGFSTRALW